MRRAPNGSAVVRNDVYRTAAPELRPVDARGPDPYRDLQYGLDQAKVDAARSVTDGSGARVALLDSRSGRGASRARGPCASIALEPGPPRTPAKHGSIVAGILDAIENNGFGIAGVAPGAELIAIPVCTPTARAPATNAGSRTCCAAWTSRGRSARRS